MCCITQQEHISSVICHKRHKHANIIWLVVDAQWKVAAKADRKKIAHAVSQLCAFNISMFSYEFYSMGNAVDNNNKINNNNSHYWLQESIHNYVQLHNCGPHTKVTVFKAGLFVGQPFPMQSHSHTHQSHSHTHQSHFHTHHGEATIEWPHAT